MTRLQRLLPALLVAGLALSTAHGAAAQSLNDLANQFLRPQQGPDRDAASRDAYERGRADAYRDQRDREFRDRDDRRAEEDRRRRFDEEQRRRAEIDRDRGYDNRPYDNGAYGNRAPAPGYGR